MAYAKRFPSLLRALPPLLERDESRFLQKHQALQIVDGRLQMQAQGRAYDALAAHELVAHLGQPAEHVHAACTRRGNATVAVLLRCRDAPGGSAFALDLHAPTCLGQVLFALGAGVATTGTNITAGIV